jgi:hypothetical protein
MARQSIKTSSDILRLLNKTATDLLADTITEGKARAVTYICSTAGQIIRNVELESKIEQLETEVERLSHAK